jgi:hypothetical protein
VNSSGRVTSLTALTGNGEKTIDATALRRILGLRSTWFTVGVMSLAAPGGAVTYGSGTRLTGVARGIKGIVLQQRVAGVWKPVGSLTPGADGSLSVAVKPTATTDYRLAAAKVTGNAARVAVAPLVRLTAPRTQQALGGIVRPIIAGAAVAIQRQQGAGWTTVARTTVGANGAFVAQLQLTSGTYRARVTPGHGLVPGLSQVLQVSTS